jgi:hypothetical protein
MVDRLGFCSEIWPEHPIGEKVYVKLLAEFWDPSPVDSSKLNVSSRKPWALTPGR